MAAPTGKGVTPVRSVRIPDNPWEPAKAKAARKGESLADVIERALIAYVANDNICSCGREFSARNGLANHARKCPTEQARSVAFVERVLNSTLAEIEGTRS